MPTNWTGRTSLNTSWIGRSVIGYTWDTIPGSWDSNTLTWDTAFSGVPATSWTGRTSI